MNPAEELLAVHLAELGLGKKVERQYEYVPGRGFKADFAVPLRHLLIEITGGIYTKQAHGSVTGILADNERLNLATRHGWRMLRFTPDQVSDGSAKAFVAEVLGVT